MRALFLIVCMFLSLFLPAAAQNPAFEQFNTEKELAVNALKERLDEIGTQIYIYDEFSSSQNSFTQKALMAGKDSSLVHDMNENWTNNPAHGKSCIRVEQDTVPGDWGGWLFLNGYLPKGSDRPMLNNGSLPGQGMDLTGAEKLVFQARGEVGGEIVEFFTGGFGYEGNSIVTTVSYPDSMMKKSLGYIALTKEWREYTIYLSSLDLSSITCGFGFAMSGDKSGVRNNVFYLDNIRFVGRFPQTHPMLRSYETDNIYIQNAAFTYDNALAAMAFISEGMEAEAASILDSIVYAVENDRYKPGRIRNAYASGDIRAFPGWESGAKLPGWYDNESAAWFEDRFQTGSNVGNTSYAALALLAYDSVFGGDTYLKTAEALMNWVLDECTDSHDGFTAGYDGWPEGNPPVVYPFTYKSTEHNIDAYAAFRALAKITGNPRYQAAAENAFRFIVSMYDPENKLFWTGTLDDGITPNQSNIVLDAQVWTSLAFGNDFEPYAAAWDVVEEMKTQEGAYPFCLSNEGGGWWAEGTSFTALALRLRGENEKAADALSALSSIQNENGLFPAATVESLSTGFEIFTGDPWNYSMDLHITPTAWFILALNGFNPYLTE